MCPSRIAFKKEERGFTVMEVVLVLAIAGLIFAMVFIALPALQRSQRDTQRRRDAGIVAAAVRQYMANNSGNGPPTTDVVSIIEYDEDDERSNIFGGNGSGWQTSGDSADLRKYLVDLNAGSVTNSVSVDNLTTGAGKSTTNLAYTVGDADMEGLVTVIIGAKCPDMSSQTKSYFEVEVTHLRSDVAIIRYLEAGWWYCLDG